MPKPQAEVGSGVLNNGFKVATGPLTGANWMCGINQRRFAMYRVTRRQMIRAGAAAGAALAAGTATAAPKKQKVISFTELFLPEQLTKEELRAAKGAKFTPLVFAESTFWMGILDFLSDGVPHTWIGLYAPHQDGGFRRCLLAESWAAGKIEAGVDLQTGVLSLREGANSELRGQLVLACNLRTIGTQHSILER